MPCYNCAHEVVHPHPFHVEVPLDEILAKHPQYRDIAALNPNPEVYKPTEADLRHMRGGSCMDPDPPSSARQRRRQVESVRKEIDKIEWVFKKKEAEGKKASEAVERNYAKLKVRLEMLKAVLKEAQAAQEREGDDLSAGDLDGGCSDGLYHDFGGAEVGEAHRHVAGD